MSLLLFVAVVAEPVAAQNPPPSGGYDTDNSGGTTEGSVTASAGDARAGEGEGAPRVVSLAPSPYAGCGFQRAPLGDLLQVYFTDFFGAEALQIIRNSANESDDDGVTVTNVGFFPQLISALHAIAYFVNIPVSEGTDFDTEYVLVDCPPGAVRQDLYVWQATDPPPAVLVAAYRQQAYDETPIPVGGIGVSPVGSLDVPLVVNLAAWLWTDPDVWAPVTASAGIPDIVTVTTTATPSHVTWDPGTGDPPFTCDGPGTPWQPGLDESQADCTYRYLRSSADQSGLVYTLTQTVTWTVTWVCEPACGSGSLPNIDIVDTTDVAVAEVQAVNT